MYNKKSLFKGLKSPQDFLYKVDDILPGTHDSPIKKACSLWLLERLAREARKVHNADFLLKDDNLERYKPILHVGWGMDCLAETGFDYCRFSKIINETADRRYRLLALEPIGVISIACEHPLRCSLIGINVPPVPNKKTFCNFIDCFKEEELSIISHGYGRGLYFRSLSLFSALKRAQDCPDCFYSHTALSGLAFAYTMVNICNLDSVLRTESRLPGHDLSEDQISHFRKGIITALSFLEWNFPGVLNSLPHSLHISQAQEQVAFYNRQGGVFSL